MTLINKRWKDHPIIGELANDDYIPITDKTYEQDRYFTPAQMVSKVKSDPAIADMLTYTSGINTGDQDLSSKENVGVALGLLLAHAANHPAPTLRDERNQIAGDYEPLRGEDQNYVTDNDITNLNNLSGTNSGDQVISDETISITNVTTNNVSPTKHGFAPKGDGDVNKFLNANGVYSIPVVETGSNVSALNDLTDVDTVTEPPAKNDLLIFNGTNYVPAPMGTTFTFSCTGFSDGQATTQLIGSGVVFPINTMVFTATYLNGPPTISDVQMSINGGAYNNVGVMNPADYTTGTNNLGSINYPSTKDSYLVFRLNSSDGTDSDVDADAAIYFRNYIRWGSSSTQSGFTEGIVEGLSGSSISNSYNSSRSINAGAGQFLVLAYPASYATIHASGFRFNNVTCPFNSAETISITNSAGFTENYKVFSSVNSNLGNSTLQVYTSAQIIDPLYYGASTKGNGYSATDIKGLGNSSITNDNTQSWNSIDAAVGEYLVFAFPTRLGIPTFFVGGFEGGFLDPETVSVTNINGYTENYYVWRSTNSGLGATIVVTV